MYSGNLPAVFTSLLSVYRQVSNIRRALVGNLIFDHSDVVGASPVGLSTLRFGASDIRDFTVIFLSQRTVHDETEASMTGEAGEGGGGG